MIIRGKSFIFAHCEPWETPLKTSKHYLAQYFAQNNRVLYVEGPWHPLQILRYPTYFWKQVTRSWKKPCEVSQNLYVMSAPSLLPFHGCTRLFSPLAINRLNQRIAVSAIHRSLDILGMDRPIVLVYYGTIMPELSRLHPRLVVAHIVDEWTGLSGVSAEYSTIEMDLLRHAHLTIVSSETLLDSKRTLSSNIHLVRHGADLHLFRQALLSTTPVPHDLMAIPEPRIGYYGALHKLDLNLVAYCARQHPEWSFVFIGPQSGRQGANLSSLNAYRNIHFLGPRPHSSLPGYLKGFQVAIMPFVINRLTLAMCPIKVYEFLAAGRAVVSVDLPEVRVLGDVVSIARSPEEFVRNLEQALIEQSGEFVFNRCQHAARFDWENSIAAVETLLQEALDDHASHEIA